MKAFAATDPGFAAGSHYSTREHPIQSFQWADYSAKPGHRYTFTVTALKGTPQALTPHASTAVEVRTESPETGDHDIYFNRGVAASQEYVRRFGNRAPGEVANRKAFEWLSRGLNEALESFVRATTPGVHALRIAAYEFNYPEFLAVVRETVDRGVDVQVVYDSRSEKPGKKNDLAVADAGLAAVCKMRRASKSYISHNKFIVKLENGLPTSVWTAARTSPRAASTGTRTWRTSSRTRSSRASSLPTGRGLRRIPRTVCSGRRSR